MQDEDGEPEPGGRPVQVLDEVAPARTAGVTGASGDQGAEAGGEAEQDEGRQAGAAGGEPEIHATARPGLSISFSRGVVGFGAGNRSAGRKT